MSRAPLLWLGLSFLLYCLLPLVFPLLTHYDQVPAADIRTFAPSLTEGLVYGLGVVLLYFFYLRAYQAGRSRALSLTAILGITLLLALPALLAYPINANDVFRYYVRARLTTVYGVSPLEVAPAAFAADPYVPLAGEWAGETSPYGPLWELVAAGIAAASGENLLTALLAFKVLALAAHLGSAALIWRQQPDTTLKVERTLLWAWNPALLLMFAMDGHNDSLMLFLLLLGTSLLRRKPLAGILVALLGPLIKLIGLLPLPFLFLQAWQLQPDRKARQRLLLGTVVGGVLLVYLTFVPFGSPLTLLQRLASEASDSAGFSPSVALWLLLDHVGQAPAVESLELVSMALFMALAGWLLWRTWQGRNALRGAADIFFAYLVTALTFRIWYTVWPFPWLLLERRPGPRLVGGLALLLTAQLSVVVYGHVRVYLLGMEQRPAHVIGVLLVFALPLAAGVVAARRQRSDRHRR
jgi:alpha-1,6-mannosyltransferase